MTVPDRTLVVVTDANVLINLHHIGQLPLLGRLGPYSFIVPEEVIREIQVPEQRASVQEAVAAGHLRPFVIDELDALGLFAELRDLMGCGEAACLAAAAIAGYAIASDEKKRFRRKAVELLGEARILRTEELIIHGIRSNQVTVAQADEFKAVLALHRYIMPFDSFEAIL